MEAAEYLVEGLKSCCLNRLQLCVMCHDGCHIERAVMLAANA